jgi:iduronate 2-sulfatase
MSERSRLITALLPICLSVCLWPVFIPSTAAQPRAARRKPNVLFIAIDDLRPQLGCYGDRVVKSPNIDRLAARGLVFNRAYVQQALCSPSRTSLLTGLRPDTTRVFDLTTHFRDAVPDAVTLPQLFKQHGYQSLGFYKIFHLIPSDPRAFGNMDDPRSWSRPLWLPTKSVYGPRGEALKQRKLAEMERAGVKMDYSNIPRGYSTEAPDVPDHQLADGETAEQAVKALGEVKGQPFFLAVGFYKPHLPFIAPKKYWDLYSPADIKLPVNRFPPQGAPSFALQKYADVRLYEDFPKSGELSAAQQRELLHGYLACISFVDAQVGKLLAELDRLGLRDNTIVALWGDHGYQVGEHDMWASKHTNFETSTRAPLIVSVPGQKTAGRKTDALVEFVDLFPSLAELCGLPLPEGLEGTSFKPLLDDPRRPWKSAAFSQYPRGKLMGRSMRTERYRYTEWAEDGKGVVAVELYDHATDPQENVNIARQPEQSGLLAELSRKLHAGWRAALPANVAGRQSSR